MSTKTAIETTDEPAPQLGLPWLLFALAATALVYWRSLAGAFVYDDRLLIARNPELANLANIPSLFTRPYWDFLAPGEGEDLRLVTRGWADVDELRAAVHAGTRRP